MLDYKYTAIHTLVCIRINCKTVKPYKDMIQHKS